MLHARDQKTPLPFHLTLARKQRSNLPHQALRMSIKPSDAARLQQSCPVHDHLSHATAVRLQQGRKNRHGNKVGSAGFSCHALFFFFSFFQSALSGCWGGVAAWDMATFLG